MDAIKVVNRLTRGLNTLIYQHRNAVWLQSTYYTISDGLAI